MAELATVAMARQPSMADRRLRYVVLTAFVGLITMTSVHELSADEPPDRFPVLSDREAWERLPHADPALPEWAKTLAQPLPRATGALLLLDTQHRLHNPLGQQLAGQLRWIAADSIGCPYARECAESDLMQAGQTIEQIHRLRDRGAPWSRIEDATFVFADKITRAAYTVTDDEAAELIDHYGAAQFTAIVHTLAFANFQNRLFLALRSTHDEAGPQRPVEWPVDLLRATAAPAPQRPSHEQLLSADAGDAPVSRVEWDHQSLSILDARQLSQQKRPGRVPIPEASALSFLSEEQQRRSERVVWSRVSLGYQPEMTLGWFRLMDAFREESELDRIFANSMFWVVTRSNECYY